MNFKCTNCEEIQTYHKYVCVIGDKETIYKHNGEEILCKKCNMKMIPEKIKGDFRSNFIKFSALTPQERQQVLKKRSNQHFKKEIAEVKREMDLSHIDKNRKRKK